MSLKELAVELFCQFDDENKGYITQSQLLNCSSKDGLFSEFSEGQILSIFELLDKEHKGVITLNDFTDAFVTDTHKGGSADQYYTDENGVFVEEDNCLSTFSTWKPNENDEEIFRRSPSPRIFEYGSTESLPHQFNELSSLQPIKIERSQSYHCYEDFEWKDDDTRKLDCLDLPVSRKRTDSLPSIMNPLIMKRTKVNLLDSKKWHSVDQGIDKCSSSTNNFVNLFEENNNLKNHRLNGLTKSDSRIDKLLVPLKKLSKDLSSSRDELRRKHGYRTKRRRVDSFFGSRESVLSSIRCRSCSSLLYSSNEDISNIHSNRPKRANSHVSRLLQMQKPCYLKQSSSEYLNSDDFDCSDEETATNLSKNNKYLSRDSLLSNQNGFYLSCENVSSPIVDVSIECWEVFLRKIGGVSMFAGNTKLRYLWKQITSYQNDLLLPFEDFLKAVIEEHNFVLTKCQDVETTLHVKIEQHEKALDSVYEELEKTLSKELSHQEKQFIEREESIRYEYKRSLEMKETTCQENMKYVNEISERYEHCKEELTNLQQSKTKSQLLYQQSVEEQLRTSCELEHLVYENKMLKERLKRSNDQNREFQECMTQINNAVKTEQNKYQSFVRKYEDLLEEKEFLEANVSNLSWENLELRNMSKSFIQKPEDMSFNASINSNLPVTVTSPIKTAPPTNGDVSPLVTSSPCPTKLHSHHQVVEGGRKKRRSQMMSLKDEMDADIEVANHFKFDENDVDEIENEKFQGDSDIHNNFLNNDAGHTDDIPFEESLQGELIDAHVDDDDDDDDCGENNQQADQETMMKSIEEEDQDRDVITVDKVENATEERCEDQDDLSSTIVIPQPVIMNPTIRFARSTQSEFKVIFCGDASVGKTSLIHRICFDSFNEDRKTTLKIDCYPKKVPNGKNTVNLLLWDTLGQERYNSLTRSYYRRSDIVVLTYDITSVESFKNTAKWMNVIKEFTDENVLIMLVGNKMDSEEKRCVCDAKAENFAKQHDAVFLEVSAKSGENIHSLLHIISSTMINQADYVMIQNYFDVSAISTNLANKKKMFNSNPCCQ